jgi:hypothetical protein
MAEFKSRFAKVEPDFKSKSASSSFRSKFAKKEPETTFGGLLKSAGAGTAAGFTAPGRFLGAGLEVIEDITGINLPGEEITDASKFAQEFWQKRIGKSKAESLVGQATEVIGTIGSTAAVIAGTGGVAGAGGATTFAGGAKTAVGGKALLLSLSAGAGLDKTATERREGTPVLNAYGAGVVTAAAEYLTEKIPLGRLQKIGNKFFRRLAEGAIADIGGEMASTAIELSIVDKRILNKDHHLTTEQYFDILKNTAAVALISTVGLSVGAKGLQLTGDTVDANNQINPPPNPLLLPPKEKAEITTESALAREDSKSEFPELSRQVDPTTPDVNLELNPSTTEDVPAELANLPVEEKSKTTFEETQDKSRAYSLEKHRLTGTKIWESLVRNWVDVSGNIQKALSKFGNDGKRVAMMQNAINGASSEAAAVIDVIDKEVYSGLNKNEKNLFDDWKAAKRGLELRASRGADFKLAEGHTEQSLNDFLDRVPDHYKEAFTKRNEAYKKGMDNILGLLESEQLITKEELARLREAGKEYLPREVIDFVDPEIQRRGKEGKTITVRDSGLKNLSEDGSDRLIETDTQLLMAQTQQRAWTRIYRNRAALELQRLARTNKEAASIVRERVPESFTKEEYTYTDDKGKTVTVQVKDEAALTRKLKGKQVSNLRKVHGAKPVYAALPSDEMAISVMNEGVRNELAMPIALGSEWITGDPILSSTQASIIGWVSGNKVLKAMATTLNPEFAITNIPRDLAHIWMTTEEYSSFSPLAAMQMHADMIAVAKDAAAKTGIYNQYIENGGGMEFLAHRGKLGLKGNNALSKSISGMENYMSKIGEFSEAVTRLALMRRAMRNGKSPFEAAQIARGYLDFARGGSAAKAVNAAIPFFNAGIQATRGIVRAAKGNKMVFGAKALQIGAMAMGLYYANKKMYPEDWEDVPDFDKENSFIFLLPSTYKDKDGEERRRYFKLPKDQGQKVFAMIFENMARRLEGEKVDGIKIANVVKDYLPVVPGEVLPPVIEMMLGYSVNRDFWTREDIWRGEEVIPQEEYNKYTPEVFVQAGRVSGFSPERLRYATKQLFTNGNIWTSAVGYGAEEVMKVLTDDERERVSEMTLDQTPGIRRLMKSTRPGLAEKKEIERQKIDINTERLKRNREFDALADRFFNGNTDLAEVNEYIKRVPREEKKRIRRRFKTQRRLQGVTNRGFWFDLLDLPPEARAVNYWNKWVQLDDAGKRELTRQSRRVPGFRSKRFNNTFRKMRRFSAQTEVKR